MILTFGVGGIKNQLGQCRVTMSVMGGDLSRVALATGLPIVGREQGTHAVIPVEETHFQGSR